MSTDVPEVPVPVGSLVPVGSIIAYAGNAEDPLVKADLRNEGWLVCDGSQLSKTDYPFLFGRIGSRYGGNNDVFRLPDYRGLFLRGVSGGSGRDPDMTRRTAPPDGSTTGVGSTQASATMKPKNFRVSDSGYHGHDANAAHAHTVAQYRWNNHSGNERANMTVAVIDANDYVPTWYNQAVSSTGSDGGHDHGSSGEHVHTVSGFDDESRPPNIYVYWLIKFA